MAASSTASLDTILKLGEDSGNAAATLAVTPTFQPPTSQYTAGTGAGQVDLNHISRQTIASGSPVSLDLSGGGMVTLMGRAANFARVSTLSIYNRGTNNVTLSGNFMTTTFGASFSYPLKPGGRFTADDPSATGMAVTNSTADTITITSSAGSNDVDIAIAGRSV